MSLEKLWRKKPIVIIIIGAIALGLILPNLTRIAVFSWAKEVPIEYGYDAVQDYWVISSVISESESFKMVLTPSSSDTASDDTVVETQRELQIAFIPMPPVSDTNLLVTNIQFEAQQLPQTYEKVPVYDVNDAGWLTTARYSVDVALDGVDVGGAIYRINYKEPKTAEITVEGETIIINNLGMLPQGVEVPSGDLVTVSDPYGVQHIWNKADLFKMIDDWNSGRTFIRTGITYYDWSFVWQKTADKGWLPQDVQLTHISDVSYTSSMSGVTLTYSGIVFAGFISLYVPASLVDTITYQVNTPKAQIVSTTPSELPAIDEGTSTTLDVTVKNVGTKGSISISLTSSSYAITPLTETQREFTENEQFTFRFEVSALNVLADTEASVDILAYGSGGSDTLTVYGTILDVEGYTPPTPSDRSYIIVTVVEEGTFKPVADMPVTVLAGVLHGPKSTDGSGKVEFDLDTFEGAAKIETTETSQYSKAEKTVGIIAGSPKLATLMVRPHGYVDWTPLILAVALGGAVIIIFGLYKKRKKIF